MKLVCVYNQAKNGTLSLSDYKIKKIPFSKNEFQLVTI